MEAQLELTSRVEDEHFWFRGFRAFIEPLVRDAAGRRPNPRILDCGCGTGYNLHWLAQHGRPFGFDLTPGGLTLARGRGQRVVRASITDIPFGDGTADVLTSFDVLQYVEDDGAVLREMARVLAPGGTLIVSAAAMDVLRGGHAAEWPEVRRYSRARIRRIAEAAGLHVERATYMFASLFPMMLAVRALRRRVEREAPGDDWEMQVPVAPVNAALAGMLKVEAALTRRLPMAPAGSSVLLVALKP